MSASVIPLAIPNIGELERKYLNECIDSTFVSTVGPFVDKFEEMLGDLHDSPKGVATNSGTTALHVALVAVGVKPGDLVICPSYTFIASANAIRHQQADPWLFDVCADNWTIDVDQVEKALHSETSKEGDDLIHKKTCRRVSCILPVYTLGSVADMHRVQALGDEFGLPVVADAAAAIGARYRNHSIGGLADLTCFSFNGNKTITSGGGGMVIGNNDELIGRVRHLSTTARVTADYDYDMVGYNYRMTNVQAALGCAQAERLDSFLKSKRSINSRYQQALSDIASISPIPDASWSESVNWFSGVVLEHDCLMDTKSVIAKLNQEKIQARTFWKPVHLQAPYLHCISEPMTLTQRVWDKVVTLPCSTNLTEDEQGRTINAVRAIFKNA